jgi:hypothetical protein
MTSSVPLRFVYSAVTLISVFILPWWSSLTLGVMGVFVFPSFYEVLFVGVFLDSLYGERAVSFILGYRFTLALSVFFLLSFFIKESFSLESHS